MEPFNEADISNLNLLYCTLFSEKIQSIVVDSLANSMATSWKDSRASHSDLTIVCKDETFPVHSHVLSSRSTVFKAMLSHDTIETKDRKIEIVDADPDTVECFLG